ncbi:hypothetical protein ACMZ6Y_01065 [Streptococcus pluranimalium]
MESYFPKWNQDRIVYSWKDDSLRIGADDVDVVEIKGNSKFWSDLISTCNGINSIEEIYELLKTQYDISEEVITKYLEKFSNRNLLEMLDKPINQIKNFKINESVETYYASEGSGGIRLLKILNQLKKTLQQNRSFL